MTYDFYAALWDEKIGKLKNKLDRIKEDKVREELLTFFENNFSSNWYSRLKEISLFVRFYENSNRDNKNLLKVGYNEYILDLKKDAVYTMNEDWALKEGENYKSKVFETIAEPKYDPETLPYSSLLHIKFTLTKPFLSKEDEEFYLHENPVTKEKIFKVPYIKASSWKGNLRWAASKQFLEDLDDDEKSVNWKERRMRLLKLFGDEKENVSHWLNRSIGKKVGKKADELGKEFDSYSRDSLPRRGRLRTYPTFFNSMDLDVINPHDRKTKTGTVPITLETVPEEKDGEKMKGEFYLLYFPFDILRDKEKKIKEEKNEDILIIVNAVFDMLTKYGFGAKTSSGYGVAEIENINVNGNDYGKDFCKMLEEILEDEYRE